MPIYEYAPVSGHCEKCQGRFDVFQKMSDADLTHCPDCGQACQRQISVPHFAMGKTHLEKEKYFSSKGFTQYKKIEKGKYEKTAGNGPDMISGD